MESTGVRGKIQVSEATAAILRSHGRDYWLQPRPDAVRVSLVGARSSLLDNGSCPLQRKLNASHLTHFRFAATQAKGKGLLKTYWANPRNKHNSASNSWETGSTDPGDDEEDITQSTDEASDALSQAHLRLVDWIVKLMSDDVRKIVSHKRAKKGDNVEFCH